jgi:tRNA-dihydrouridine synthase 1
MLTRYEVSSVSKSIPVPTSAKIRLTQPASLTLPLTLTLQNSGASWITLHARHVSSRHRRRGLADLSRVKELKQCEELRVPIISNGNVRGASISGDEDEGDIARNLRETGADGIMVGEGLLQNPWSVSLPYGLSSPLLTLLQ